ncbi:MAG: acyl-CoA dehydrogenase family protein [Bacteroidota bacterium]
MDFTLPDSHIEYQKQVIDFASTLLEDNFIDREQESKFSIDLWRACANFGLFKLLTPREYGGFDEEVDLLKAVLAMEGFGYACRDNGLALGISAQLWTIQLTLVHHATEDQKARFLTKLVSGEYLGAHALTEEIAGSDIYNMQTTAKPVDGGFILNGKKRYVGMAPLADVVITFANARPEMGAFGVTGFLLERNLGGFRSSDNQSKMGLRTHPFGEIIMEDCFVPDRNVLGGVGAGLGICNHSLEYDRCGILASNVGTMEKQLEECVQFAKQRKQFGQSVGKFQSVSNRIANMKIRLETARLLLYKLVWLKQQDKPAMLEASMLKLVLSENFLDSSLDAIRIHGGTGYLTREGIERNLRDAVGGVIYAGTSDIQRNIIAKFCGL